MVVLKMIPVPRLLYSLPPNTNSAENFGYADTKTRMDLQSANDKRKCTPDAGRTKTTTATNRRQRKNKQGSSPVVAALRVPKTPREKGAADTTKEMNELRKSDDTAAQDSDERARTDAGRCRIHPIMW